jgi:putative tryptophan/tyrosine transport system substrate-binding protein
MLTITPPPPQHWRQCLGHGQHAEDIDLHLAPQSVLRVLRDDGCGEHRAGVVDEDLDVAAGLSRRRDISRRSHVKANGREPRVADRRRITARAKPQRLMPVVGYLSSGSPSDSFPLVALRQGLKETGFVEGENVAFGYRFAQEEYDQLPALAVDLVHYQVAVIAAIGGTPPALAAKTATATVPIVFYLGVDPVLFGLVASLNRPGGNMTGVAALQSILAAKRLELLRELLPKAAVIALLVNPANPSTASEMKEMQDGARHLGLELHALRASSTRDIDAGFATLGEARAAALVVSTDQFLTNQAEQIVALAARYAVPAIYGWRQYAATGGLMSYAPNQADGYRLVGINTGRVLKGEKPADLPVQQEVKVELVLNLKTANTLGLTFPLTLLGRADEVIE